MNTKLITALRTAAKVLEDGTFYYEWESHESCNCGVLFCALTGHSADTLPVPHADGHKTWTQLLGYHCPITGVPTNKLLAGLMKVGLTVKNLSDLEYLRDPKILSRVKMPRRFFRTVRSLDYKNPAHTALYMRAWADILIEEGQMDVPSKSEFCVKEETAEPATV